MRFAIAMFIPLTLATIASAQNTKPTHRNLAYNDEDPAQVLDVYLGKSDVPLPAMIYIHGGGWAAGSKSKLPSWLMRGVNENRFSVIAVEYRFTDVAPHPAQTNDCLRAIQFTRHHSKRWNIDDHRLCATGGSAGGHLSFYVALHDDIAKPDSADLVSQESSRVACAVGFAGPTDWNLLPEIKHQHPAYRTLLGYPPETPFADMAANRVRDVSPLSHVSEDDPPIMIVHGDADAIVPVQHAHRLNMKLKSIGVKSKLIIVKGASHSIAGAGGSAPRPPDFIVQAESFVEDAFGAAPALSAAP